MNCWPEAFARPCGCCWAEPGCKAAFEPSPVDGCLFLDSFKAVVEDVGVPWFEFEGDRAWEPGKAAAWLGDDVPDEESFFFEDLFESFARDSCSC